MGKQQGGGHPDQRCQSAGWTSSLEQGQLYILGLGNMEHCLSPCNKPGCDVNTVAGDNTGPALKDIAAVAAGQVGWRAGSGQAAELFRADRDIVIFFQGLQAGIIGLAAAVITGTQAKQTAADQTFFRFMVQSFP